MLHNRHSNIVANSIAFSATAIFMLQPFMLDIAAWPFMIMQILFMTFFLLTGYFLVAFGRSPTKVSFLWLAAACAYGAMHFMGVGLAVATAMITCLIVLLVLSLREQDELRAQRGHLLVALLMLSVFTATHALMMLRTPDAEVAGTGVGLVETLRRFGGLLPALLINAVRAMWAPQGFPWPKTQALGSDAAYGWAMIAMLGTVGIHFLRQYRLAPNAERLAGLLIYFYATSVLMIIIGLIVVRTSGESNIEIMISYLIGSRYLVLVGSCMIVIVASFGMFGHPWHRNLAISLSGIVAVTALLGNISFAKQMMPSIWPHMMVSHSEVWEAATTYVQQAVATSKSVEDIAMDRVSVEFRFPLSTFEPLLRRSLDLPGSVRLSWRASEPGAQHTQESPALTEKREALRVLLQ